MCISSMYVLKVTIVMVLNPLDDLQFATYIQFHFNLTDKTTIWKKFVDTNILFWNNLM